MSFDQLPNETLVKIFNQIHLQQRISYRAVCSRWSTVIEDMCQQRKSLKLFDSVDSVHVHCGWARSQFDATEYWALQKIGQGHDDDLFIPIDKFKQEFINFLVVLFPNLTTLIVFLYEKSGTSFYSENLLLLLGKV